MSWITLTEAHIATAITGPELTAAKSVVLATGQTPPLAEVLGQVTGYVRSRVGACDKNTLGPAGTIPDELLAAAIDIAIYRLTKRLPGKILAKQERIDAADKAESLMRDVAACNVALVQPETAGEQPSAPLTGHWGGTAKWSRDPVSSSDS
jgi:hypothetical protein